MFISNYCFRINDTFFGTEYNLLNIMSSMLNFTFKLHQFKSKVEAIEKVIIPLVILSIQVGAD